MNTKIRIPYNFTPRDYQLPLLKAMDSGTKRAVWIAHRRAGKDKTLINLTVKKMLERVGTYFYFFPSYNQGRKILWEGRDKDGFKLLDHIPESIRTNTNNTEMKIELKNGSVLRVVGTDQVDSIVGTNPIGCVFSEYALQNPQAWDFIRPILAENDGWAVFNYTPRGHNHGYDIYNMANSNPSWFCELLPVTKTNAIPLSAIDEERQAGMSEDLIQQEFYCSFEAANVGSYYGTQFKIIDENKQIRNVPWMPNLPVYTSMDLGVKDPSAIWFIQIVGNEFHIIDYYEQAGGGLQSDMKVLKEKQYAYSINYAPHDIEVHEYAAAGLSRLEIARSLGINLTKVPLQSIEDGIEAVRSILPRCYFDEEKCKQGIRALREYHSEFDEKRKVYRANPEHDWSSHGADAFRYFAVGHHKPVNRNVSLNYAANRPALGS